MRNLRIRQGIFAMVLMAALVLAGCDTGGGGGRAPVRDGTYITYGFGYNPITPLRVSTTFARNSIVRIGVIAHGETEPLLQAAEQRFIPRIIQHQSILTPADVVAGSTASSMGIRSAVAAAITEAGGNPLQWEVAPPRRNRTVVLPHTGDPFDVIVVGLGASGMAAFMSASEQPDTTVFGIERAGKIGGNSAITGGGFAINAERVARFYGLPENYAVLPGLDPIEVFYDHFGATFGGRTTVNNPHFPDATQRWSEHGGWAGGARMDVFRKFLEESGQTMSWLFTSPYYFNFIPPSGGGFRDNTLTTTHNWGGANWNPGAPWSRPDQEERWTQQTGPDGNPIPGTGIPGFFQDLPNLHITTMFTRAVNTARARNPRNDFVLELTAKSIITEDGTPDGRIIGVEAEYRDGTTFMIMGNSVILATGGFIGSPAMQQAYFGTVMRTYAVTPGIGGDGIRMGRELGAATFNIGSPGAIHISQMQNLIRDRINHQDVTSQAIDGKWKQTLTSLMLKPNNLTVARGLALTLEGPGQPRVDLRGQRFMGEAGTPNDWIAPHHTIPQGQPGHNLTQFPRSISNEGQRAGGYFAAIFDEATLFSYENTPPGFTVSIIAPFGIQQGVPVPPDQPIPFIRPLIDWAVQTGNAIRAVDIADLERQLGVPAGRLLPTITEYNAIVERAQAYYEAGYRTWPGQNINVPNSTPDPLSGVFNYLSGNFNLGKPLTNAAGQLLWNKPIDPNGPFVVILGANYTYGNNGGLDVNTMMQVMRLGPSPDDQEPIPGLFAVGQESLGVLHHRNRTYSNAGGKAMGWVLTSGRLAGYYAATMRGDN